MMVLELFLGFLRVGCFSFGGAYGAIPLIREIVLAHGWIDDEMISYMIAVSESTPGPIMIGLATYVGSVKAGLAGSLAATAAVVLPSYFVILLITVSLKNAIKNPYVQAALSGLKPCVIGIVLATGAFMMIENGLVPGGAAPMIKPLLLTVILTAVYFGSRKIKKGGISPILLICISAVLGIIAYGI